MTGCKALTDAEIKAVLSKLENMRDKALFVLGVRTGFRISELLSLKVDDVRTGGQIADRITVSRRNTKGKRASRSIALHHEAKEAIQAYIESVGGISPGHFLFLSSKSGKAITPQHAWRILDAAFKAAGIDGNTGTHTMRKTFAKNVYEIMGGNLLGAQKALGHKSLTSTAHYLSFSDEDEIDQAVLSA